RGSGARRFLGADAGFAAQSAGKRKLAAATIHPIRYRESPMPFPIFDRSRLRIQPLARRHHDLDLSVLLPLEAPPSTFSHPALPVLGKRLIEAKSNNRARILMMGAHVIRAGVSRFIIDLMERGFIDHVAMNGAGPIHDWEFALIGATTESVARYVQSGEF